MRFLVTGGAGFIGSHLVDRLIAEDHQVSVIDNLSTGSLKNLEQSISKIEFHDADILDKELVDKLVANSDVVFHMAAAVGVKNIIDNPIQSLASNYNGSENVLHSSSKHNKRLFIASTSEVYGKNLNQPLSETHDRVVGPPQKLRWTYSDAKALEEALAYALYLKEGLQVTTLRFFNTVGPRQTGMYGMVVPRFVTAALKNETLEVHGDGTQSRVFCHVDDVLDVLMQLIEKDDTVGEVFNIGGQGEISIMHLANQVISQLESKSDIKLIPYEQAYDATFEDMQRRVPDIEKISSRLGWTPKRNLSDIINDIAKSIKN